MGTIYAIKTIRFCRLFHSVGSLAQLKFLCCLETPILSLSVMKSQLFLGC